MRVADIVNVTDRHQFVQYARRYREGSVHGFYEIYRFDPRQFPLSRRRVCLARAGKRDDSPRDSGDSAGRALGSDSVERERKEREIRDELFKLSLDHRELDNEIATLEAAGSIDQLLITRLKRRKLKLKDQITTLEDQLLPDIIA